MQHLFTVMVAVLFLAVSQVALGADELPAGGKVIIGEDSLKREGGVFRVVAAEGQGFKQALEANVEKPGETPWSIQFSAVCKEAIKKGDVLHVRFFARAVESMTGSASLPVVYELAAPPHTKSMETAVTVGTQWQRIDLPFVAKQDFAAGGSVLCIRLGAMQQKVQIGGLQVVNFGKGVKVSDLPRTRMEYDGRDANAAWRKEATVRIERLRKGDLKIIVQDAAGKPVPDAKITARLQKHAFGFGTCISMRLMEDSADGEMYRKKVKELFSTAVIENELKWPRLDEFKFQRADQLVKWLGENGIPTRGHCLVWPAEKWMPKPIAALRGPALEKAIQDHVTETVSHYKGQLIDWDVINEPFTNHQVMDRLGKKVMVDWFKAARAADPDVKLYINDYEILASGNMLGTAHQNHYYETIKYLKENGAPIDGIGMQAHFGSNITSPENLLKILDRFAALGLRIKVTELDIRMDDEQLRADYMRDFHIALFSHPAVDGILQWGFWEGAHWIPETAIFAKDWTIRKHGQAWIDLVHGEWKTKATGTTDAKGACGIRGFLGTYEVAVSVNGKTQVFHATVEKAGREALLVLK